MVSGREICCSVTTGNNLCADDAGLRGRTASSVHLKHRAAAQTHTYTHGHTRTHTWRVSFTLVINKNGDYVLYNNAWLFFSPSALAYTHAHTQDEKSKICKAATG